MFPCNTYEASFFILAEIIKNLQGKDAKEAAKLHDEILCHVFKEFSLELAAFLYLYFHVFQDKTKDFVLECCHRLSVMVPDRYSDYRSAAKDLLVFLQDTSNKDKVKSVPEEGKQAPQHPWCVGDLKTPEMWKRFRANQSPLDITTKAAEKKVFKLPPSSSVVQQQKPMSWADKCRS